MMKPRHLQNAKTFGHGPASKLIRTLQGDFPGPAEVVPQYGLVLLRERLELIDCGLHSTLPFRGGDRCSTSDFRDDLELVHEPSDARQSEAKAA